METVPTENWCWSIHQEAFSCKADGSHHLSWGAKSYPCDHTCGEQQLQMAFVKCQWDLLPPNALQISVGNS